jgi:hypothetical protein
MRSGRVRGKGQGLGVGKGNRRSLDCDTLTRGFARDDRGETGIRGRSVPTLAIQPQGWGTLG